VSRKWQSARTIRQEACLDVLKGGSDQLDSSFFIALDGRRVELDKQFWKAGIIQITITGFLMLSLLDLKETHFSIFGISFDAISNAREFLLFCHALTIGFMIVLQQNIQKNRRYARRVCEIYDWRR
jgi:hypothetical protein